MKNALRILLVVTLVLTMVTASTASASPPKCDQTTGLIQPDCDGDGDDDSGGGGGCSPVGCTEPYDSDALSGAALSVV